MVVMDDCDGAKAFLQEGEGLVVPPNPESIANAVNQLLGEKGEEMGGKASKRVRRERDYDSMYNVVRNMVRASETEVTVITTSFNKGAYINDCCWSVDLQRKYGKVNHIVVDAGSRDQTHDVLKLWGNKVKVFTNIGQSQTASLNFAYEQMLKHFPDTEFVGWLNADDYYMENWLTESLNAIKGVDVTCGRYHLVDVTKNIKRPDVDPGADQIPDEVDLRQFMGRNTLCQPTVLMRRNTLDYQRRRYGYVWNPEYEFTQDLELWIRLLKDGFTIRRIRKTLACLRHYPGQMSTTHADQQKREFDRTQLMVR